MWRAALILGVVLVSGAAWAGEGAWLRQRVANHPISLELPGKPTHSRSTSSWGPFGTAETDTLELDAGEVRFRVSATVAPQWAIKGAGNALIFTTTRDTFLRRRGGKALSWESVERNGLEGRRLTYALEGQERTGVLEVFVDSPYILAIDAEPGDDGGKVLLDRFFGSVRVEQ